MHRLRGIEAGEVRMVQRAVGARVQPIVGIVISACAAAPNAAATNASAALPSGTWLRSAAPEMFS